MASSQSCPSIYPLRCTVISFADVKMLNISIVFMRMASIKSLRAVLCTFHNLFKDM
jgi:hypothetical protein